LDGSNFIAVLGVRLVLVGIELSYTDQQRKVSLLIIRLKVVMVIKSWYVKKPD
jgi:hypothetical protein